MFVIYVRDDINNFALADNPKLGLAISNDICHDLFCVQSFEVKGCCSFCWYL